MAYLPRDKISKTKLSQIQAVVYHSSPHATSTSPTEVTGISNRTFDLRFDLQSPVAGDVNIGAEYWGFGRPPQMTADTTSSEQRTKGTKLSFSGDSCLSEASHIAASCHIADCWPNEDLAHSCLTNSVESNRETFTPYDAPLLETKFGHIATDGHRVCPPSRDYPDADVFRKVKPQQPDQYICILSHSPTMNTDETSTACARLRRNFILDLFAQHQTSRDWRQNRENLENLHTRGGSASRSDSNRPVEKLCSSQYERRTPESSKSVKMGNRRAGIPDRRAAKGDSDPPRGQRLSSSQEDDNIESGSRSGIDAQDSVRTSITPDASRCVQALLQTVPGRAHASDMVRRNNEGVMGPTRQSRGTEYPRPSSPYQRIHATSADIHEIGETGRNEGRNLCARIGNDGTPRLRQPIRIRRGRPVEWRHRGSVMAIQAPPSASTIPARTSLEEICRHYPKHVWGTGLRLFLAEGWDAKRIWNKLPADARLSGSQERPWNYLQQAIRREAGKMTSEEDFSSSQVPTRSAGVSAKRGSSSEGDGSINKRLRVSQGRLGSVERSPQPPRSQPSSVERTSLPFVLRPPSDSDDVFGTLPRMAVGTSTSHPASSPGRMTARIGPGRLLVQPLPVYRTGERYDHRGMDALATNYLHIPLQLRDLDVEIQHQRMNIQHRLALEILSYLEPNFSQMHPHQQSDRAGEWLCAYWTFVTIAEARRIGMDVRGRPGDSFWMAMDRFRFPTEAANSERRALINLHREVHRWTNFLSFVAEQHRNRVRQNRQSLPLARRLLDHDGGSVRSSTRNEDGTTTAGMLLLSSPPGTVDPVVLERNLSSDIGFDTSPVISGLLNYRSNLFNRPLGHSSLWQPNIDHESHREEPSDDTNTENHK